MKKSYTLILFPLLFLLGQCGESEDLSNSLGFNGCDECPVIYVDGGVSYTLDSRETNISISGHAENALSPGRWELKKNKKKIMSGIIPLSKEKDFKLTLPVLCENSFIILFFDNERETSSFVIGLSKTSCTPQDLQVSLTWDREPVDLDLHLIRPEGSFGSKDDCFWENCRSQTPDEIKPAWGETKESSDDPLLNINSNFGGSPENIILNNPEEGEFRVFVTYFNDMQLGPTNGVVNVLIEENSIYNFNVTLSSPDEKIEVCTIKWPEREVEDLSHKEIDLQ